MAKKYAITTNKTTFYHFGEKAECERVALEIMAKMSAVYGDTIIKIKRVWRDG